MPVVCSMSIESLGFFSYSRTCLFVRKVRTIQTPLCLRSVFIESLLRSRDISTENASHERRSVSYDFLFISTFKIMSKPKLAHLRQRWEHRESTTTSHPSLPKRLPNNSLYFPLNDFPVFQVIFIFIRQPMPRYTNSPLQPQIPQRFLLHLGTKGKSFLW